MHLVAGFALAGAPLVTIELLSRWLHFSGELARKTTHVLGSLAVIGLTLFCSLHEITFIAAGFFILMGTLRRKRLWQSLYGVDRKSWGEVTFPLGIAVASLLTKDVGVFVVAVLIMGLADTVASLAGQAFGKRALPLVKTKSYAGSATFFICAYLILALACGLLFSPAILVVTAFLAAGEAVSRLGLDNLVVPALAVICIEALSLPVNI